MGFHLYSSLRPSKQSSKQTGKNNLEKQTVWETENNKQPTSHTVYDILIHIRGDNAKRPNSSVSSQEPCLGPGLGSTTGRSKQRSLRIFSCSHSLRRLHILPLPQASTPPYVGLKTDPTEPSAHGRNCLPKILLLLGINLYPSVKEKNKTRISAQCLCVFLNWPNYILFLIPKSPLKSLESKIRYNLNH